MPIRPALRSLYPLHWKALSAEVRFGRARGICQSCGRPHGTTVRVLPGGRWFDPAQGYWRNHKGRTIQHPDLIEQIDTRLTRVILAAAHLDHNPRNNRFGNLRALCQRCHLIHDRLYHARQRAMTYRLRSALGDLFDGPYCPEDISSFRAMVMASTRVPAMREVRRPHPVHRLIPRSIPGFWG